MPLILTEQERQCTAPPAVHTFKELALVYSSGIRAVKTRTIGFGRGLCFGRNRGASQSRLS
jgi:hypothetical protein